MTWSPSSFRDHKRGALWCGILLIAVLPAGAQMAPAPSPAGPDYKTTIAAFFDLDKQLKYKEAADCLLNSNPANADNAAMHEELFTALDGIRQKCGDLKKFSTVLDKRLGSDIAYVNGIGVFEKGAIRFEFVFSQQDDGKWELLTCSYSYDVLGDLRTLAGLPTTTGKDGGK